MTGVALSPLDSQLLLLPIIALIVVLFVFVIVDLDHELRERMERPRRNRAGEYAPGPRELEAWLLDEAREAAAGERP